MDYQDCYVFPEKAREKLKQAEKSGQTVLITGMTGYGKTALTEHYLHRRKVIRLDGEKDSQKAFDLLLSREPSQERIPVVIDNLQFADNEGVRTAIVQLLNRKNLWVILISRAANPNWLIGYRFKVAPFMEITQKDLALSREETEALLQRAELPLADESFDRLYTQTRGHGMTLSMFIYQYKAAGGTQSAESLIPIVRKTLWDYVEHDVFAHWDRWVLDNLMQLSIVDSFTRELAEEITGTSRVTAVLEQAETMGSFLRYADGRYEIAETPRQILRSCMEKRFSSQQKNDLYYNVGRYYRRTGQVALALQMFERCSNEDQIRQILEEAARSQPGTHYLYSLRSYFFRMDPEQLRKSPDLMCGMSMLCSLAMDPEQSEYWYSQLEEALKTAGGSERRKISSILTYLNIALPHRGSVQVKDLISTAAAALLDRKIQLPEFSVTSNSASNMNGGKDFCGWSRADRELASSVGRAVSLVLGRHGAGIVDLAIAESFLEKGEDDYQVIKHISRGMMQAENSSMEECFVGEGLMARLHVRKGNPTEARQVLLSFRRRCELQGAEALLPNLDSMLCRIDLFEGDSAACLKWLREASPNEDEQFYILDRYRYLTKIRVYITQGRLDRARSLLQRLLYYAEHYERQYIRMESLLLLAIVQYRSGDDLWRRTFEEAYRQLEDLGFVRLLTGEGAAALELMERAGLQPEKPEFYRTVRAELKQMAAYYPAYLTALPGEETITGNALQILRYQAQGMSNEEIAEQMAISLSTVKYHCRENYQKLGVKSRTAAVTEARRRRLI